MTTSATGGYLVATPPVSGGLDLDVIWQGFVAGVTGLDGAMVRPAWQPVSQFWRLNTSISIISLMPIYFTLPLISC